MKDRAREFYFPLIKSRFKNIGIRCSIVEQRWDWYISVDITIHIIPYGDTDPTTYAFTMNSDYIYTGDSLDIVIVSLIERIKRRIMYEAFFTNEKQ